MLFPLEPIGPAGSSPRSPGPHFVIAAGAPESPSEALLPAAPESARYLAADGGYRLLRKLGVRPEALIGDLDSLTEDEIGDAQHQGIEIEQHPSEKDASDLELAILRAHRLGARRLTLIGCLGGQFDHAVLNLLAPLTLCYKLGIWARLLTAEAELYHLTSGANIRSCRGYRISLGALSEQVDGLTLTGFKYPLHTATLYRRETRGLANVIESDEASIAMTAGTLLACLVKQTPTLP